MLDTGKLQEFVGKMVLELGAVASAPLVVIGDKLGLYKSMAGAGGLTPAELATRTNTDERYVREWLCTQAASGYVEYDPITGSFTLPPEQAYVFADEDSPVFLPGAFQAYAAFFTGEPKIAEAFRTGAGVGWHEHDGCLFHGTGRFFRSGYKANLVSSWLPALEGVEEKLHKGALVADIGCGHGASTILMAQAYPASSFIGFDYHSASIEQARQAAAEAGVEDRCTFVGATAKEFPGRDYDLIASFDSLHDMGDPVGAASHIRKSLATDGTWLIVEPFANDRIEDNLNPVGRLYYSASTMVCTPASRAQEVGLALGAQAGEGRIREVVEAGGFTRFRRATETPFNLIFEACP